MNIFTDLATGKFRGGIIYFAFENEAHSKITVSFENPHTGEELLINMDHALACEFTEGDNVFIDAPVTIDAKKFNYGLRLERTGEVRPAKAYSLTSTEEAAIQYLVDKLLVNLGEMPTEDVKAEAKQTKIGTHLSHCCAFHGCKYGDGERCPVESKSYKQAHPCENCRTVEEISAELSDLKQELDFVEALV